jgi:hypothetical protein
MKMDGKKIILKPNNVILGKNEIHKIKFSDEEL